MLKKLVSYLIIFSILIPDLGGWGNRPAYAMINDPEEEGEEQSFIPVKSQKLSEQAPILDGKTNSQQSLAASGQNPSTTVDEKEHQEEMAQKNPRILDLGHGIASPDEGKEGVAVTKGDEKKEWLEGKEQIKSQDAASESFEESSSELSTSLPQSLGGEGVGSYQYKPNPQSYSLMSLKDALDRDEESNRDENSSLTEKTPLNGKGVLSQQRRSFQFGDLDPFFAEPKRRSIPSDNKRASSSFGDLVRGTGSELEDLTTYEGSHVVAINDNLQLSTEMEEFLRYVKIRIIDGKLNWKQIMSGVVGAALMGGGIAVFMLWIFFEDVSKNFLTDGEIEQYTQAIVLYIMALTFAFDAASRTGSILIQFTGDQIASFSIRKSNTHLMALWGCGGSFYASAFVAGLMPAYYLYNIICNGPYLGCTSDSPVQAQDLAGLAIGGSFLAFDTALHYGHQLSHHVQRWIDDYFFHQSLEKLMTSSIEKKRQNYLSEFKNLQKLIRGLSGEKIGDLYKDIFLNAEKQNDDISSEILTLKEALRILKSFQVFYKKYSYYIDSDEKENEKRANWKKEVASWAGWGGALLASIGRHFVFWYVVYELLENLPEGLQLPLSVIFGGIIAGFVQGWIEKDAIQKTAFDMLGGDKISEPHSYGLLRRGIMAFNCFAGTMFTLPYIFAGLKATLFWPTWTRIATLVPFGVADSLNNAVAFHDSNLDVLNACDSVLSYCYATEGYKRDKLIRMTRQLRRLFKDLRPEVLEEVDFALNKDGGNIQEEDCQGDGHDDENGRETDDQQRSDEKGAKDYRKKKGRSDGYEKI